MPNKQRGECRAAEEARAEMPGLGSLAVGCRASVLLLLALMVTLAQGAWPLDQSQGQVEVLGDMMVDGPGELEASMHSSILSDFQAVEALEPVADAVQQSAVGARGVSGFPDSSAVVGRVFQMKVPVKTDHSRNMVKVRTLITHY